MQGKLVISPDVLKALREGAPVVALESTIISHGMPYPQVAPKLPLHCYRGKSNIDLRHGHALACNCIGILLAGKTAILFWPRHQITE